MKSKISFPLFQKLEILLEMTGSAVIDVGLSCRDARLEIVHFALATHPARIACSSGLILCFSGEARQH